MKLDPSLMVVTSYFNAHFERNTYYEVCFTCRISCISYSNMGADYLLFHIDLQSCVFLSGSLNYSKICGAFSV